MNISMVYLSYIFHNFLNWKKTSDCTCVSLVCILMLLVCICVLLVCIRMLPVCLLVCYPYVPVWYLDWNTTRVQAGTIRVTCIRVTHTYTRVHSRVPNQDPYNPASYPITNFSLKIVLNWWTRSWQFVVFKIISPEMKSVWLKVISRAFQ